MLPGFLASLLLNETATLEQSRAAGKSASNASTSANRSGCFHRNALRENDITQIAQTARKPGTKFIKYFELRDRSRRGLVAMATPSARYLEGADGQLLAREADVAKLYRYGSCNRGHAESRRSR